MAKVSTMIGDMLYKLLVSFIRGRASTITRGALWAMAMVAAKAGAEAPPEQATEKVIGWAIGVILLLLSVAWSYAKDTWLEAKLPATKRN